MPLQHVPTIERNNVIVINHDYDEPHIYEVELDTDGSVKGCECKGWIYHNKCHHVDSVEQNHYIRKWVTGSALFEEEIPGGILVWEIINETGTQRQLIGFLEIETVEVLEQELKRRRISKSVLKNLPDYSKWFQI